MASKNVPRGEKKTRWVVNPRTSGDGPVLHPIHLARQGTTRKHRPRVRVRACTTSQHKLNAAEREWSGL